MFLIDVHHLKKILVVIVEGGKWDSHGYPHSPWGMNTQHPPIWKVGSGLVQQEHLQILVFMDQL